MAYYKISDECQMNIWEDGSPIWVHIEVKGRSCSLTDYELKCLISAAQECLKRRNEIEWAEHQKSVAREVADIARTREDR